MAYLAACSLSPQAGYATLVLQSNTLIPSPIQAAPQAWKLWTSGTVGSSNLTLTVS